MSNIPFTRLDDYGLITYLNMKGYEVQANDGLFKVRISMNSLEKEIDLYKISDFKKFDDTSKKLKKILKISRDKTPQISWIQDHAPTSAENK